jgi:hypothetical protein
MGDKMENHFLKSIQSNHPALWESIIETSKSGLIIIDEENDAISATNRLLFTYPDLHEAISTLINEWEEMELKRTDKQIFQEIIGELHVK